MKFEFNMMGTYFEITLIATLSPVSLDLPLRTYAKDPLIKLGEKEGLGS